jgi:hypothetical protein
MKEEDQQRNSPKSPPEQTMADITKQETDIKANFATYRGYDDDHNLDLLDRLLKAIDDIGTYNTIFTTGKKGSFRRQLDVLLKYSIEYKAYPEEKNRIMNFKCNTANDLKTLKNKILDFKEKFSNTFLRFRTHEFLEWAIDHFRTPPTFIMFHDVEKDKQKYQEIVKFANIFNEIFPKPRGGEWGAAVTRAAPVIIVPPYWEKTGGYRKTKRARKGKGKGKASRRR